VTQGPKCGSGRKDNTAAADKKQVEAWATMEEIKTNDEDAMHSLAATTVGAVPPWLAQACKPESKLYDSGASQHMSPFHERFATYQSILPHAITVANKHVFYTVRTGDLQVKVPNGNSSTTILLRDALHAPDMGITIISVSHIAKARYSVCFKGNSCKIQNWSSETIGDILASTNSLYKVEHVCMAVDPIKHIDLVMLQGQLSHIAPDAIWTLI
jgi:hypothetical protein